MKYLDVRLIFRQEIGRDKLGNPLMGDIYSDTYTGRVSGSWYETASMDSRDVSQSAPEMLIRAPYGEVIRAAAVEVGGKRYNFNGVYELRGGWQLLEMEVGKHGKIRTNA